MSEVGRLGPMVMLISRHRKLVGRRITIMCPTKIVIRFCLARASICVLAVIAVLNLGAIKPGEGSGEVRVDMREPSFGSCALPGHELPAYGSYKSRRFAEIGQAELKGKPVLTSRHMGVASAA
jgi:hypothetical protein